MSALAAARLFTESELDRLGTPLSLRVHDAAVGRDTHDIADVVDLMHRECIATYGDKWTAILQTVLVENGGEPDHDAAVLWAADVTLRPFVRRYAGLSLADHIELLVRRLRASGSTFSIEQDDERIRFILDPWGPTRLSRSPEGWQADAPVRRVDHRCVYPSFGAYGRPGGVTLLEKSAWLTGSTDPLPCLLATEFLFLERLAVEELGAPIAVIGVPTAEGAPSTLDVYRDPRAVPAEVLARVGARNAPKPAERPDANMMFSEEQIRTWETPLSVQVETAAADADWAALAAISDRMDTELVGAKDPMTIFRTALLTWIAREWGEPAVEATFARSAPFVMRGWFDLVADMSPRESIAAWAMIFRAHGSTFDVAEDDETVTFRGVLGACGRMIAPAGPEEPLRVGRRVLYPTFGVYDPPMSLHTLSEPARMTHGKPTHPIYSAHCHVFHEQHPIEVLGHPLFLEFHPDTPGGDVIHVHAKTPGAFPSEYRRRAHLDG